MTKENDAFPELSKSENIEAKREGVKEAVKETTKDAFARGGNEGYGNEGKPQRFSGSKPVLQLLHLLDLSVEDLAKALGEKAEPALSEDQIAGLAEAERSGKNRTDYVEVFKKRLGVKSIYEVTDAGPAFTIDTSSTSAV